MADEQAESPYERAVKTLTKQALRQAVRNLGHRERRVLELRYGLDGERPRTLEHVAPTFHVTRGHVRQLETRRSSSSRVDRVRPHDERLDREQPMTALIEVVP